jgi:hypothetical protein
MSFNMQIDTTDDKFVCKCIDRIVESRPILLNNYSILASELRKEFNIDITKERVQEICEEEDSIIEKKELPELEATTKGSEDLRDMYEDSIANALGWGFELPELRDFGEGGRL